MHKIPKSKMMMFLEKMMLIRACEESFVEKILDKTILCPVHLYSGQEAIAVGVCSALERKDYVFGNHRSHGHYLAKGGDLNKLVAEVYCRETGCSGGYGGSMHVIDNRCGFLGSAPIVAGTISLAVGAALASKICKENRVVVSFLGDGAAGEGVLYESLNFAALIKLPVIFVCENNLYSTHMPIGDCRVNKDIYKIAEPLGVQGYQVDGNDVIKVAEISRKAVEYCRSGSGPIFLEAMTYRFRGHVGPDDNIQGQHTDIRPRKEIEAWKRRDPVAVLKKHLLENNILTEEGFNEIQLKIIDKVEKAHHFAQYSNFPEWNRIENIS